MMMMMMMTMMMMMDDDDILAPKGCAEGLQPKSHHPGVSNQQKHQPAKAGPESRPTQSPSRGTSPKPESWWTGLGPGQGPGYGLEFCSNETERKTQSASQSAPKINPVRYHGAKNNDQGGGSTGSPTDRAGLEGGLGPQPACCSHRSLQSTVSVDVF